MKNLKEKIVNLSTLIENQLPLFVRQDNPKFISFLTSYYESQEIKYNSLDIVNNIIDYYNIGNYTKTELIESTKLSSNLLSTSTTITVDSTVGFPSTNGYIKINDEIIFYRTKTDTEFVDCVRGTSAFILENKPFSEVIFTESKYNPNTKNTSFDHLSGSVVYNVAYTFTEEFFRRIKFEIAPTLPETFVEELNITTFLKNVKSFYESKGSLNSHRILFRIIFNDKKVKIRLQPRGSGAKITVSNYSGQLGYVLPDSTIVGYEIVAGGTDYDSRKNGSVLINPPIVEVLGSGTGEKNSTTNIIPKTAIINVTDIDSTGAITDISIENRGQNYVGPIRVRVRERSFSQDQIVKNVSGTGVGRVEAWDFGSNELILYDVVGYFKVDDEVLGEGGETPRAFISRAYPVNDINRKGNPSIEVISLDPDVEYPKEQTLRPSSSNFYSKKIIRAELLNGSISKDTNIITLVQEKDLDYGLNGISIETEIFSSVVNNIYEFEIGSNIDYGQLVLPSSTKSVYQISSISSSTSPFILTVDDAYGFPLEGGYLLIGSSKIIEYSSRTSNQFFGCVYKGTGTFNIEVRDNIVSYGRRRNNLLWKSGESVSAGEYRYYGNNLYMALNDGITGNTAPTHTKDYLMDGSFSVNWQYIQDNVINYHLAGYQSLDQEPSLFFKLLGVPSEIVLEDGGALYLTNKHSVVDKLINTNTTPEVTSWKINSNFNTVGSASLPSYKNTTGIHAVYDYENHNYVASSGIPPYLTSITGRKTCINQKLLKRVKKSSIRSTAKKGTDSTNKAIGITVDGVQIQSVKGNIIEYGKLKTITLASPGDYKVPVKSDNINFNYEKYPVFEIDGITSIISNTSSSNVVYISSRISKINIANLGSTYLTGYTDKPSIKVINNNPLGKNPKDFRHAELELSFNPTTNTIDNILIKDSGNGYIAAPTIQIFGGGKSSQNLPLTSTDGDIFEFRGGLISASKYDSETEYNIIDVSTLISTIFSQPPKIKVNAGDYATFSIYTSDGAISSTALNNNGKYYYTIPTVEVFGVGSNAVLKPIIDISTGKITEILIVNEGSGYRIPPVGRIVPSGSGGSASASLFKWTFNLGNRLTADNYGGYVFDETDDDPKGALNVSEVTKNNLPKSIDDKEYLLVKYAANFNTYYGVTSTKHSPIIGWAYDGNPIYGRYGYSSAMNSSSSITALASRWSLKTSRTDGPSTTDYPLGTFVEDYTFSTNNANQLDRYNGRYCVTPEFPNGTYAYFATTAFPFFVGLEYYSEVDSFNVCGERKNDRVPGKFVRINDINNDFYPAEDNLLTRTILTSSKFNLGTINEIIIENAGSDYKVGDKLLVDGSNTYGTDFNAYVSILNGKTINSYKFTENNTKIEVTTNTSHSLSIGDFVKINLLKTNTRITDVPTETTFVIDKPKTFTTLNEQLSYTTTSRNTTGSIVDFIISNVGRNYKKLPAVVGIETSTGSGALVQLNSDSISKINKFKYSNVGGDIPSNKTIHYDIQVPYTAKIKNNFEIYKIEIINGGNAYQATDIVVVDGVNILSDNDDFEFKIICPTGSITEIQVIKGGQNLSKIPSISILSSTGTGASVKAVIKRKNLLKNDTLYFKEFSQTAIKGTVVNFDSATSTLEFNPSNFNIQNNTTLYTFEGKPYGEIFSIRHAKAYLKSGAYTNIEAKFLDNYGFLNDNTQRLTDSKYYQDWSYTLVSQRNTKEWKPAVLTNTHPSGFRAFGKKIIENRKSFFERPEDVFNSSVIFTTNLSNILNLNLKLSACKKHYVAVINPSNYSVGDYVFGNISRAKGVISAISENYLEIVLLNDVRFISGEYLTVVTYDFAVGNLSESLNSLIFYYGILQQPVESYTISQDNLIPYFQLNLSDEITKYVLNSPYEVIDYVISSDRKQIQLFRDGDPFTPSNKRQLLISIAGIVQSTSDFTVTNNVVTFNSDEIEDDSLVYILHHPNLLNLTFTSVSSTTYTINYTPSSSCQLLLFTNSVGQSQLLTDFTVSGNQIVFSEPVTLQNIFGWYVNETVECELVNIADIISRTVLDSRPCAIKKLTNKIESSSVKTPNSLYQISKELLDGTVYAVDNTTVHGYDTRFTYTNPEYSTSYVEVLKELTFNGTTKSFTLTKFDGTSYVPSNGKNTLMVYIDNQVIHPDLYSISSSTITFTNAYASSNKCTIIDFVSQHLANSTTQKSANLDNLNVVQNGTRKTFNLSDRGVPQYARNNGDLFVINNGLLKRPDSVNHTISQNKITFVTAPSSSDEIKLAYFNRQLLPSSTKNIILDPFRCFNGVTKSFPLTVDGILITPISVYHLYVIRSGVYQKPGVDYTVSGSTIVFSEAPFANDNIWLYYSYDGLNQNIPFDSFKKYDGTTTDFPLTTNFVSTDVYSASNIQVYRNGVYQYPTTDYTIINGLTAPTISFVTPPVIGDDIFITNFNNYTDFVDVTSRFTQSGTNSLQYTSASPEVDTTVLVIYVNGILQTPDTWTFSSNLLTFDGFVSLTLDKVRIFAFANAKRMLDTITMVSGVTTYPLQVSGSNITTNLPTANDLLVSIEGVVQNPGEAYTVSGASITLNDTIFTPGKQIVIYQVGNSTYPVELLDYLNDDYNKSTYKLTNNYASFVPPNVDDIFVLRNGILQNPTQDFYINNGSITFTTNITEDDDLFIMYTHGTEEIGITNITGNVITLSSTLTSLEYKNLVLHVNGVPQFYQKDFQITGNTVTLLGNPPDSGTTAFAVKYPNVIFVDELDDCPNGTRTTFKLLYNNQNIVASEVVTDADILISVNGVVQYPGVQYTISPNRGLVYFTTPPQFTDEIFMVKMSGNQVVDLSLVSGKTYNLSQTVPTSEAQNLVIFSNNTWKFNELNEFSYNTTSRVTLTVANQSPATLFGIKFFGGFKLLDQINTPFNGTNKKFNLFELEQNFMPIGTIENDSVPSDTSILVTKNGDILEAGVDYTLHGDINSQIEFTVAPVSTDIILVKSVGSFLKLKNITSGFGSTSKVFTLKKQNDSTYYPNYDIARPREHENQILVIRNGKIQSPLYDYYIDNDKLVFLNAVTSTTNGSSTKLVILDFRGTVKDVEVLSRSYQLNKGDTIDIAGETVSRVVDEIVSPTILKTTTFTGTKPSGFVGTSTISGGKVSDITISNGGLNYDYPVIIRTKGTGIGAKATAQVDRLTGNKVTTPVEIVYSGDNIYTSQEVVATSYAYTYRNRLLSSGEVKKATKLITAVNTSSAIETFTVGNTENAPKNPPLVTITSSSGSGATFRPFVSKGRIRKIQILTGGIGYDDRDVQITLSGGGGSGCVLEPVLDAFGTVTAVNVKNTGEGYDTFRAIIASSNYEVIEYTDYTETQLIGCTRPSVRYSHSAWTTSNNTLVYFDNYI